MSPSLVRRLVVGVCVVGIAGMIVSSIADNNGAALTFGLVAAAAVLCSIVATAVSGQATAADADDEAAEVEARIQGLVHSGVDETALRDLVRSAVRLGRASR